MSQETAQEVVGRYIKYRSTNTVVTTSFTEKEDGRLWAASTVAAPDTKNPKSAFIQAQISAGHELKNKLESYHFLSPTEETCMKEADFIAKEFLRFQEGGDGVIHLALTQIQDEELTIGLHEAGAGTATAHESPTPGGSASRGRAFYPGQMGDFQSNDPSQPSPAVQRAMNSFSPSLQEGMEAERRRNRLHVPTAATPNLPSDEERAQLQSLLARGGTGESSGHAPVPRDKPLPKLPAQTTSGTSRYQAGPSTASSSTARAQPQQMTHQHRPRDVVTAPRSSQRTSPSKPGLRERLRRTFSRTNLEASPSDAPPVPQWPAESSSSAVHPGSQQTYITDPLNTAPSQQLTLMTSANSAGGTDTISPVSPVADMEELKNFKDQLDRENH